MARYIDETGGAYAWKGCMQELISGDEGAIFARLNRNSDRGHCLPLKEFLYMYREAQVPFNIVEYERQYQVEAKEAYEEKLAAMEDDSEQRSNANDKKRKECDSGDYGDNVPDHPEWDHLPKFLVQYDQFRPRYAFDIPIVMAKWDVDYVDHESNTVNGSILCIRNHPTGHDKHEGSGAYYREPHHMQSILQREELKPTAGDLYASRMILMPEIPEEKFKPVAVCLDYWHNDDEDYPGIEQYNGIALSKPLSLVGRGELTASTKKYSIQMVIKPVFVPDDLEIDRNLIQVHNNIAFFAAVEFDIEYDLTPYPRPILLPPGFTAERTISVDKMDNFYRYSKLMQTAAAVTRPNEPAELHADGRNDRDIIVMFINNLSMFDDDSARLHWMFAQGRNILAQAITTITREYAR
jgi:hypothetical protein